MTIISQSKYSEILYDVYSFLAGSALSVIIPLKQLGVFSTGLRTLYNHAKLQYKNYCNVDAEEIYSPSELLTQLGGLLIGAAIEPSSENNESLGRLSSAVIGLGYATLLYDAVNCLRYTVQNTRSEKRRRRPMRPVF